MSVIFVRSKMAEQRGDLFHTILEEILNFLNSNIFFIAVLFKEFIKQ